MTTPTTVDKKVCHVMSQEAYKRLESLLPPPWCGESDTPSQIAHKLGVQLVLKHLREGFVVS